MKHLTPEQLSAFLDNELRGKASEEAEAHLASCAGCREELAQLAALEKLTREAEPSPADESYFATFSQRVQEGIAREKPVPLGESLREWFKKLTAVPVFGLQWMGGVAVAALVVGFGIYLYQHPYLVQPAFKAAHEAPRTAEKNEAPPTPMVTATPSGDLTVGAGAAGTGESLALASRMERPMAEVERGGREGYIADGKTNAGGKPAEAPVLAERRAGSGAEKGLVSTTETVAADKVVSIPAEKKDEGPEKAQAGEFARLQPEVPASAPAAGAKPEVSGASTATRPPSPVAKEEDRLGKLAGPSIRARTGEKEASDDELLFAEAQVKQSNQAYRDAANDYDSLVRNYPKSPRLDDAHYNLALSEYANSQQTRRSEDMKRALTISKAFLKAARDSARKAQVNRQVVVLERQLKEIK
jgi:TolA-binding protein